jgi:hypothetical protein
MGFELWKTLGISWQAGMGILIVGTFAATMAAVLVSRRRAANPARSGLRLGAPD